MNKIQTTMYLTKRQHKNLHAEAKAKEIAVAELLRRIIDRYYERSFNWQEEGQSNK